MISRTCLLVLVLVFGVVSASQSRIAKTFEEIQKALISASTSPLVHLVLIYDSAKTKGPIEEMMNQIADSKKGYIEVKVIDCNTKDQKILKEFAYCQEQTRKMLPALMFSEPPLNIKNSQELTEPKFKPYEGSLDQKKLFNFAVPLMPLYSVELKNQKDLKNFQQTYPKTPTIIYFTDKQKIPPFYRALTANFRHTIAFAHSFSKSALAETLKITQFPTFLLNGKEPIPKESKLEDMIERLKAIEGQPTDINIHEYQTSKIAEVNTDNLQKLVYEQQDHIIIHFSHSDGTEHKQWPTILKKFNKMFKIYEVSSSPEIWKSLKQKLNVKQTPAIIYFPKSLVKKDVQKTIFYSKTTFDQIYAEIDSLIDDFTMAVADEIEMQKHISIQLQDEKLAAILFHEKQRSLAYKILSNNNHLEDNIAFFRMKDPKPQILQQFQIKKLPALIILMQDQESKQKTKEQAKQSEGSQKQKGVSLKIAQYTGPFNYEGLYGYFTNFVKMPSSKKQEYHHAQQQDSSTINLDSEIKQIKTLKKFEKTCKSDNCYLLLINNSEDNAKNNNGHINTLAKQSEKMPASTNFAYVDAVCHSQILSTFQVMEDQLPVLIYVNSKFEKYSRMIGRLEGNSISTFFNKIKSGRGMYRGYDKLVFNEKNCEKQHEKIKKMNQGETQLSEQQAKILEQLRQQQQKKRQQYKETVQKDKVRKKGKKRRPKNQEDQDL